MITATRRKEREHLCGSDALSALVPERVEMVWAVCWCRFNARYPSTTLSGQAGRSIYPVHT